VRALRVGGRGGGIKYTDKQFIFSQCFMLTISIGMGSFVSFVRVVERGVLQVLGLLQILVSYSSSITMYFVSIR
jgi:hypothetical protein